MSKCESLPRHERDMVACHIRRDPTPHMTRALFIYVHVLIRRLTFMC